MRNAPIVSPAIEEAIHKLAGQFTSRSHITVVSEHDRLELHVLVEYGQVLRWNVSDYFYAAKDVARKLHFISRNKPWELNATNLLFAWDESGERLLKQKIVAPEDQDNDGDPA